MHVCRKLNKHDYYFTLQFVNINIGTDQLENTYLSIHTHSNVQQLSLDGEDACFDFFLLVILQLLVMCIDKSRCLQYRYQQKDPM